MKLCKNHNKESAFIIRAMLSAAKLSADIGVPVFASIHNEDFCRARNEA